MNDLISIIVPVYKVEQYLPKCVNSICSQTYRNLEIILVDDGSPDNCGRICDEYAEKDQRIRVIHNSINKGLGFARNSGLEICTGAYIMFVDSDDFLSPDAVEVLYKRIVEDDSDMAVGKHTDLYENGDLNGSFCRWMKDAIVSKNDIFETMGSQNRIAVFSQVKLYRRYLFDDLRYPSLKCSEDLWVFPFLIERCERISIVDHLIYYYLQRSTSILHQPTEERILDDLYAGLAFVRFLWDRGYRQSALWWFTVKVDKALILKNKETGIALFVEMFGRQEIHHILKAAGVKTQVKWMALHNPKVNIAFQYVKKVLKRG